MTEAQIRSLVLSTIASNGRKISELPAAASLDFDDYAPMVDANALSTKRSTYGLLLTKVTGRVTVGQDLRNFDVSTIVDGSILYISGIVAADDGGEGLWRYDASSVATDNIGTVIQPDVGSGRFLRQYTGPINVKWFAAKGDGVSNDTVPLQSAIDTAIAASLPLYVPSGRYIATSYLTVTGALRIFGDGYNTRISITTTTVGFAVSADNVTMEKFRIDGATSRMISAGKVSGTGLLLRDLDISGATVDALTLAIAGIYADGYSNVLVDHCYVHGCGQAATPRGHSICFNNGVLTVSTNVVVNNSRIETTNAAFGITYFNCTESAALFNEVSGSTLSSDATSSGYGITFYKTGGALADTNNNRIIGNFIYNTQGIGAYFTNNDGSVVNSNIIRNTCQSQTEATLTVGGVGLNTCTNMTVNGNTILTSTRNGICISGTNIVVTNNNIAAIGNYGVRFLSAASGHVLSGNRIAGAVYGMGSDSVALTDSTIASNNFTGCTYGALFFATLTECSVTGNNVKSCDRGFQFSAGSNNSITGNVMKTLANKGIDCAATATLIASNRIDSGAVAGIDVSTAGAASGNRVRDNLITNTVNPIVTSEFAVVQTITAGNPNALLADTFRLTYAGATNVTAIANGNYGQQVTLYAANGNSTIKNGANLILSGAVDFAMAASNTLTLAALDNSTWIEIGRKV